MKIPKRFSEPSKTSKRVVENNQKGGLLDPNGHDKNSPKHLFMASFAYATVSYMDTREWAATLMKPT